MRYPPSIQKELKEAQSWDNYLNSFVVYCPETNRLGYMYPRTWIGKIIFLEDVPNNDIPITYFNVLFDDDRQFKTFEFIGRL